MIEHTAWLGADYKFGIKNQRVAIVGYSHWGGESEEDTAEGTRECMNRVISGEWKILFFTQIRNYFGYKDHERFWRSVMFFNFLPDCVGGPSQRFNNGTQEQIACGQERFLRLIREQQPEKAFIFTGRHWVFPKTYAAQQQLGPNFPRFSLGQYRVCDHTVKAFFLRHPQGANGDLLRGAVSYAIDLQVSID